MIDLIANNCFVCEVFWSMNDTSIPRYHTEVSFAIKVLAVWLIFFFIRTFSYSYKGRRQGFDSKKETFAGRQSRIPGQRQTLS